MNKIKEYSDILIIILIVVIMLQQGHIVQMSDRVTALEKRPLVPLRFAEEIVAMDKDIDNLRRLITFVKMDSASKASVDVIKADVYSLEQSVFAIKRYLSSAHGYYSY